MASLARMTVPQLDTYAKEKDITFPDDVTTKEEKINYIQASEDNDIVLNVGGKLFAVPASRAGDIRLVRALRQIDEAGEDTKASLFASLDMLDILFGDDMPEVEDAVKDPDGTVPLEKIAQLANEFFKQTSAKN